MAHRDTLVRAYVIGAKKVAADTGTTVVAVLESLIVGQFKTLSRNGRTVVSTSEAGGSTTFSIPADLAPDDVMDLATEALDFITSQADPNNPSASSRRIKRFRASFAKASL